MSLQVAKYAKYAVFITVFVYIGVLWSLSAVSPDWLTIGIIAVFLIFILQMILQDFTKINKKVNLAFYIIGSIGMLILLVFSINEENVAYSIVTFIIFLASFIKMLLVLKQKALL